MSLLDTTTVAPVGRSLPGRSPGEERLCSQGQQTVDERFVEFVTRHPHAIAVIDGDRRWSYGELNRQANGIAVRLLATIGDRTAPVAILMDVEADVIPAIYGTLRAGKFYVPMDPELPAKRLQFLLEETDAQVLICSQRHLGLAKSILPSGTALLVAGVDFDPVDTHLPLLASPEDLAYVMYTSGSTGVPKGVMHTHQNLYMESVRLGRDLRVDADDCFGLLFSASSSASCCSIFGALLNGASLSCFDLHCSPISAMPDWLEKNNITICDINVAALRLFAASLSEPTEFSSVRVIAPGGELLYGHDVELCRQLFGKDCIVQSSLGTTETRTISQYFISSEMPIDGPTVPTGWPVEGKRVMLLTEEGEEAEQGEIAVSSLYLSTGYWKRDDLTAQVFRKDPRGSGQRIYLTGDLGKRLPDGRIVHLRRKDTQVKIRGYRVDVAEVENLLLGIEGVEDVAVCSRKYDDRTTYLIAFIIISPDATLRAEELQQRCRDSLPNASQPSAFFRVSQLPKTNNGKLARRQLHNLQGEAILSESIPYRAPETDLEVSLCEILSRVLDCDRVGIDDEFEGLNADSLQTLECILEIEQRHQCRINPQDFLACKTVGRLAQRLSELAKTNNSDYFISYTDSHLRSPLFLFPGIHGTAFHLSDGASRIDQRFQPIGVEILAGDLDSDFTELANRLTARLREHHPSGPFYLLGYSFGGILAYEVARQLRNSGREVRFIGVIDMSPPNMRPSRFRKALVLLANLVPIICSKDKHVRLQSIQQTIAKRVRKWWKWVRGRSAHPLQQRPVSPTRLSWNHQLLRQRGQACLDLIQAYHPRTSDIRISLFYTQERSYFRTLLLLDQWQQLVGNRLQSIKIPGNHVSMLRTPHAEQLWAAVNAALDHQLSADSDSSPTLI